MMSITAPINKAAYYFVFFCYGKNVCHNLLVHCEPFNASAALE